ncbi:type II secretion system protein GspM [Uliginosibacterium aquaticum]|uniref:Type II secretion system protein M n=1 Tax=Uliginosibacterium aquaticum TaxID=2731212 RepID=A0ABX2IGJ4_9RHOO|nr:type II secretion system protein GspM [Uliginosibacterium aquaticum]NSL55387.1 type II secretion system protein M [Uliginosibacterium aquaticum]
MKKAWLFVADRFDALQARERLLVFLGLAALLAGIFMFSVLEPALSRYRQARQSLQESTRSLASLSQEESLLIEGSQRDPDAAERSALGEAEREIALLHSRLTGPEARLLAPERMSALLQALIAAQKNLLLVSIRSGEPVDLLAAASAPAATPGGSSLYRHSVKLVLQGDYPALAAYLHAVESLPVQLEVSAYTLQVQEWPQARLSLTLDFNSLERAWLGF